MPQHRAQDPRPDPLRAQRAGNDGPRVAGRSRRDRCGRARGRRPGRQRDPDGCLLHRRPSGARRVASRARPARGPDAGILRERLRRTHRPRARRRHALRMGDVVAQTAVEQLVARSNRLGSDPRNTNYAGGNTSAKGTDTDPATGRDVELLWVKGSGGDLGTLTEAGLAVLRLDRVRALVDVYRGEAYEDDMVAAFDYCLHGHGAAGPSIDTAMHALVDAPHVDHLHPDSGIAVATAADGERLTKEIF